MRSADGAAPLAKGLACKRCKARKTRCSGERPACQACVRSARFKHLPVDQVRCVYGDALDELQDPRELGTGSYKAPRLSLDDRTSSASSFASTSSSNSFASTSTAGSFSASLSGYDTDATSPPLSSSSLSYTGLSLSLTLPPAPAYQHFGPPIPLARAQPLPPDPAISDLASNMSQQLDFRLPPLPQSLAARRRGAPLAIPIPQSPTYGFVPSSAPPTFGHFPTSQEALNPSAEAVEQQQAKHLVGPHFESGAVDDWNLPTPVYGGEGSATEIADDGLPTPLRELMEWGARVETGGAAVPGAMPLGMSPWPRYAPSSWEGGASGL
ncbi:hypothetical protein BCR35DRAFT_305460 [Leucosporidium creatinivorum]|uniref:Zn(2)-C6 fungal-type domain-containing protein n=1 Tax=Leucosporidium creatinivorum TaxID=106004 RepID=A0A1Y2F036_9BASI|nr:hypothetical protein BCR35DRAFT_305460 [Leucosporidium creatinivorum]